MEAHFRQSNRLRQVGVPLVTNAIPDDQSRAIDVMHPIDIVTKLALALIVNLVQLFAFDVNWPGR
jgi:hypothetical protein